MIHWRYITSDAEPAAHGLAADEYIMEQYGNWEENGFPEPTLRIYTYHSHCALVGRYQNTEAEVNLSECRKLDIEVSRRLTGGGAVIMGQHQLMVALASSSEHPAIPSHPGKTLPKLARGIIAGLEELGMKAEYRPKNDIVVNGRKIGGSAICMGENGAFLYHATVLLDFDVPLMLRALNIPDEKLSDKEFNSYEDRMSWVSRELGREVDVKQVRESICRGFEKTFKMAADHLPFNTVEKGKVDRLSEEKYGSSGWIFQRQPAHDMMGSSTVKTSGGLIRVYIALIGDMIKSALITGDFLSGDRAIKDIESALKWSRSDREAIIRTIRVATSNSSTAIEGIGTTELADIIMSAVADARKAAG